MVSVNTARVGQLFFKYRITPSGPSIVVACFKSAIVSCAVVCNITVTLYCTSAATMTKTQRVTIAQINVKYNIPLAPTETV